MKKKLIMIVMAIALIVCSCFGLAACSSNEIIVQTNAYFAPFEYMKGTEIVGVDVDIMNKVGESMGKKVKFVNADFALVIPTVSKGKMADVGAAGITITPERKELVDFSIPYYTSVQYVIVKKGEITPNKNNKNEDVVFWSQLAGKKIGVQLDTTGDIYCGIEINGDGVEGTEDYYAGELKGTGAKLNRFDSAQLAAESLGLTIDCVVVDELPAKYITKNDKYECFALYYDAETATQEDYAICVTKGNKVLLDAINKVLQSMIDDKDASGKNGIDRLVSKHLGIE